MNRVALLVCLSLVLNSPMGFAVCPKDGNPSWLVDAKTGDVYSGGEDLAAAFATKKTKICDEISAEHVKLKSDANGVPNIVGDSDEAKKFRAKIKKEASKVKPAKTKVASADTAVIAEPDTQTQATGPGPSQKCNPGDPCNEPVRACPPGVKCDNTQQDPIENQQPVPERQVEPIREVARSIDYAPESTSSSSGGGGFLSGLLSNPWVWGIGGLAIGGLIGYGLGKNHSHSDYNDYCRNYGGWNGSGYYPSPWGSYGGLPGRYRAPGTYGLSAPIFAPYPGPGGGFMTPGIGGYYGGALNGFPVAPSGFNSWGGVGGGQVSNLCTNCYLPSIYPLGYQPTF